MGTMSNPSHAAWQRLRKGAIAVALASVVASLAACGGNVSAGPPDTEPYPIDNQPGWKFVFGDNFETPAPLGTFLDKYGSKWGAYPFPYQDTSHEVRSDPGYYYPQKTLSVANGIMDAWMHYDAALGKYLVAAPIPKLPTMQYGKFILRLRSDDIAGYKVTPLLWPDSENGDDGEINLPEGTLNGADFKAFYHPEGGAKAGQAEFSTGVNSHQWHTFETDWSPGKVDLIVDGESIGSATNSVPSKPMHWVLQFETQIKKTPPPQSSQGHIQVDWVTAYTYDGPGK